MNLHCFQGKRNMETSWIQTILSSRKQKKKKKKCSHIPMLQMSPHKDTQDCSLRKKSFHVYANPTWKILPYKNVPCSNITILTLVYIYICTDIHIFPWFSFHLVILQTVSIQPIKHNRHVARLSFYDTFVSRPIFDSCSRHSRTGPKSDDQTRMSFT